MEVTARASAPAPGTVLRRAPLPRRLWIEGTSRAVVLTYATRNTFGKMATSTGTVWLPRGKAPTGGWPVISWAHGTIGLADACAPSRRGQNSPLHNVHLAKYLAAGYAVVASDYAGLGTPGLHAYLDGKTAAHNIVDMVVAGRNWARSLPVGPRLARKFVLTGQSQGAGAAIYAARYATAFSRSAGLDYRGAVGTGTPAYIEKLLNFGGPKMPPVPLTPVLTAYLTYLVTSLNYAHPELGIDTILTDTGRKYFEMAKKECLFDFEKHVDGVVMGDYFTKPLYTLPNFEATVAAYMKMPESGFDKPFFMGHGVLDQDVPYAITAAYVATLLGNGQPVTFRSYPADHVQTLTQSSADAAQFIRQRFR